MGRQLPHWSLKYLVGVLESNEGHCVALLDKRQRDRRGWSRWVSLPRKFSAPLDSASRLSPLPPCPLSRVCYQRWRLGGLLYSPFAAATGIFVLGCAHQQCWWLSGSLSLWMLGLLQARIATVCLGCFFSIFIIHVLFGMLLKDMVKSSLLSKDELLTPNIDKVMGVWKFRRKAQNTKIGKH